jgi:3-oxoacyl-[acyl-carrier protein] reductase
VPDHKVILITGTRKGIGRALAEHYISQGYAVEGCSRSDPGWEHALYRHHKLDVANEAQVKAMLVDIEKRNKRLDVLINNAGIASMNHILLTPLETVERIINTNFMGTFLLCREAAKLMRKNRFGRIVNIGTVAVPLRLEGEAIYAASKGAVMTLTQILAKELAIFGITCNMVQPTPIETDLIRNVPQEKIDLIISQLAIKRLGRFEDVANVIDFFIRPESEYVTGQVVNLGGV